MTNPFLLPGEEHLREQVRKLQIELSAAYGLIDSLQVENLRIRQTFKDTLDDVIATCEALLQELKK